MLKNSKQILIILVLILTFVGCSAKTNLLPVEIYGLSLKRSLTGAEAKKFVNQLHLQNVAQSKNEIGFYEGEKIKSSIYITTYATTNSTLTEGTKMIKKISASDNSLFTDGQYININDTQIYQCHGMNQIHYVFSNKKQLFWISADIIIAKEFLTAYLVFLDKAVFLN